MGNEHAMLFEEFSSALCGLYAVMIGRGVLKAEDLQEDLEHRVRLRKERRDIDSPLLLALIEALQAMAVEKKDVDARLAASLGTFPTKGSN